MLYVTDTMIRTRILINGIDEVKEFCSLASKQNFDIDVKSPGTRYVIDAKSIMGLFSLDLSKQIEVIMHATETEAKSFIDAIAKFHVM